MTSEKFVYADLPRTGLCNMLFPWARAVLYARDHALPMLAPEWVKIGRVGPWLRGERDKRYYFRQFTNDGYVSGLKKWWALHFEKKSVVTVRGMGEYFKDIKGEHLFLLDELMKIVSPRIRSALGQLPDEFIGVHVRRGDFAKIGLAQSMEYYLRGIQKARQIVGKPVPTLIFSDGYKEELSAIVSQGEVTVMPPCLALQDMLSLSKARVLVGTNQSTFSGWAAFLGQMPNIWEVAENVPMIGLGESFYV